MPMFFVIMLRVSAIPQLLDNPEPACRSRARSLFAGDANYYRRNIFCIDECVEIFGAGQSGKMDGVLADLRDFAAHFFSSSQVQLDRLADGALKDAACGHSRFERGFLLWVHRGTGR